MTPFDIVLIAIIVVLLIIVGKDRQYIGELKARIHKVEDNLLNFAHEITNHMELIAHSITHISTKLDVIYTRIAEVSEQEEDRQE